MPELTDRPRLGTYLSWAMLARIMTGISLGMSTGIILLVLWSMTTLS